MQIAGTGTFGSRALAPRLPQQVLRPEHRGFAVVLVVEDRRQAPGAGVIVHALSRAVRTAAPRAQHTSVPRLRPGGSSTKSSWMITRKP